MTKSLKKKNNNTLIIILGLAVLGLLVAVYFKGKSKPKGEKVLVENAEKRTIKEMVAASGKVFPETEIKISSDISGEVIALHVREGEAVKAGQLLAKIDPDSYVAGTQRAAASVSQAKANLSNSRANLERSRASLIQAEEAANQLRAQIANTQAVHDRNISLHKEGVISQADFDASLSSLESLKANLRSSEANIKNAKAGVSASEASVKASEAAIKSAEATSTESQTNLNRATIYAPTDGTISVLNVEKGERVVGTAQMAGTELMRIANLNSMEVQVDVSENDVLRVSLEDETEIEVDAYLDRKFRGKVTEIANSASNSASGTLTTDQVTNFVVKIRIDPESYKELIKPGKSHPFRPGMSASVEINTNTEKDVLTVPIQSVTTREIDADKKKKKNADDDNVKEVVFVTSAGSSEMVVVTTGIQDDNYIQILTGLEDGDEIITGPYSAVAKKLENGKVIQVVDEDELYKKKKKR